MTSALLIFFALLLYGALHSLLALPSVKQRARGWFGPAGARGYRLAYNLFALASMLPVLALVALLPDRELYRLPGIWALLALAGQAAGGLLLVAGLLHTDLWAFLGLRQLVQPAEAAAPRLVVGGLYRYMRHPLYTAGLLMVWLMPVMTLNLLALNLGLTVYILLGARLEERKLAVEFGAAYSDYRRRTAMLIPFLF